MKYVFCFLLFIPVALQAQTNRVSVNDGDFYNPLNWSPMGLPANGDSLLIVHNMTMSMDIYYNAGQIAIGSNGSLTQDAVPRNVWIDGGSLVNEGNYSTHAIYVSNFGYIFNSGTMTGIDSLLVGVDSDLTNEGTIGINDFMIMTNGTFENAGNLTNTDSMFVQGYFLNDGNAQIYDFVIDQPSYTENNGTIEVTHNMNNQGYLLNNNECTVALDFSNCNIQSQFAVLENDGIFCVGNDFANCMDDTLMGVGQYFIGGLSANDGAFVGTFTFNTPSGALSLNTGTVEAGVSFGTALCSAEIAENMLQLSIYPNPVDELINTSISNTKYEVYDLTGRLILSATTDANGVIQVSTLDEGMHVLILEGYLPVSFMKK